MLRMSYIRFMQDLQAEIRDKVGVPFRVQVDIKLGTPENIPKEKVEKFMNEYLKPIMNEIPDVVGMDVGPPKQ